VSDRLALLWRKLDHLARMREYLLYSIEQVREIVTIGDWKGLSPAQHESLAAFRVRFSEFQEHIGKTMKAIAVEEEKPSEPFTAVLLYMEKIGCLDSVERWKEIRELRNAVNHEYQDDPEALRTFFSCMLDRSPELLRWLDLLVQFCRRTYPEPPHHKP
jgi:hypothetical protein